jgi:hypothetical protein
VDCRSVWPQTIVNTAQIGAWYCVCVDGGERDGGSWKHRHVQSIVAAPLLKHLAVLDVLCCWAQTLKLLCAPVLQLQMADE